MNTALHMPHPFNPRPLLGLALAALVAAFVTGCAASPKFMTTREVPIRPVSGTALSPEAADSVRYPETLKEYAHGRYVDPNNSEVLHEKGTTYRVEQEAAWNLHSDLNQELPLPGGPDEHVADSARMPNPYTAEMEQEFRKQAAYTRALSQQNDALLTRLETLNKQSERIDSVLSENDQLRASLESTQSQVRELTTQANKPAPASTPPATFWTRLKSFFL
jgi:hypothetical protein